MIYVDLIVWVFPIIAAPPQLSGQITYTPPPPPLWLLYHNGGAIISWRGATMGKTREFIINLNTQNNKRMAYFSVTIFELIF